MPVNSDSMPILLVPGLNCSPRLYAAQIPALWRLGPVMVADHRRGETIAAITRQILAAAPGRFRLAGLSMGGYIALEIMRQASDRVAKLALLDTSARPEAPEQTERRKKLMALAETGRFSEVNNILWPVLVDPSRQSDAALRTEIDEMALETGAEAFLRQEHAIIGRADSRPSLGAIECPALMIVGSSDQLTPPAHAEEIAKGIPSAKLVVLSGCGHMSTMEKPEDVARLLVDFFAG
ncbi:MAG TPA: alpha/beta fold hydrolase [Xanthobacteraceae bacterium]|nr:alpha/beta fold hydrolase [Xanthobacteraceae bacterium]